MTASAVALEQFGEAAAGAPAVVLENGALRAQIGLASPRAFAGQQVSFFARFTLNPGWHIAPPSIVFEGPEILRQDVTFPAPEILTFPLLDESLPVHSGSFEARGSLLLRFPLPEGVLILHGSLRFQPCSETVCEPPQSIPFELPLTLQPFSHLRPRPRTHPVIMANTTENSDQKRNETLLPGISQCYSSAPEEKSWPHPVRRCPTRTSSACSSVTHLRISRSPKRSPPTSGQR